MDTNCCDKSTPASSGGGAGFSRDLLALPTRVRRPVALLEGKSPLVHVLAGAVLFAFAVSHFLGLIIPGPSDRSVNTVFPFLTNGTVYFLAGVFELAAAFVCFRQRGLDLANLAILVFLIVVVWYRWALPYTGTSDSCGCLGLLGRLYHFSKTEEKAIPIVALTLLSLAVVPWLCANVRAGVLSRGPGRAASRLQLLMLLGLVAQRGYALETVEVTGRYDTYTYNPRTGAAYSDMEKHASFVFTSSGDAWSIYATNLSARPVPSARWMPWEGIVHDGTNMYTLCPDPRGGEVTTNPVRATVSSSPLFNRSHDEFLDFYIPWLTFGLCPRRVPTNNAGIVEIPVPWWTSRASARSHGYEWQIIPSHDGRFMAECRVLRNTNLDLSEKEELLRPDINYPTSLGQRNGFCQNLASRRAMPHGFVEGLYRCTAWYRTNDITVPAASEFKFYMTSYPNSTAGLGQLRISAVAVRQGEEKLLPEPQAVTVVEDYRYRRTNETRVLRFAEYVLRPGDSWKPDNDAKLLAEATRYLKHGPRYDQFDHKQNILAWLLLLLILAGVTAMLRPKRQIKTNIN